MKVTIRIETTRGDFEIVQASMVDRVGRTVRTGREAFDAAVRDARRWVRANPEPRDRPEAVHRG